MPQVRINPDVYSEYFEDYLFYVDTPMQVLFGGAGSGKSVHSAMKDIIRILWHNKNILVARKRYNSILESYYAELQKAARNLNVYDEFVWKKSPLMVGCKRNGRVIMFRGLDDVEKIKSITPPRGSIDHTTCEEITEIEAMDFGQLQFRARGGGGKMPLERLLLLREKYEAGGEKVDILESLGVGSADELKANQKSFTALLNPVNKENWVYERLFAGNWIEGRDFVDTGDIYIMKSTHWNNQFLTDDDHFRYESYKDIDPYLYDVYTCGNWGVLGNVIFRNWKVADLSKVSRQADFFDHSVDWGWTDPYAYTKAHNNHKTRDIYIVGEGGEPMVDTAIIGHRVKQQMRHGETVWCDSAEPDRIQMFLNLGIDARGVYKGVSNGISAKRLTVEYFNQRTTYIDYRCVNHIKAFSNCTWKKDSKGKTVWDFEDNEFDHWQDSALYGQTHRAIATGAVYGF